MLAANHHGDTEFTADLGIDNKFIKEVGESLEPGGSAVFALVAEAT